MERVFHILGEALENALTPECFLVVSLVDTGDGKMRLGGGPQKTPYAIYHGLVGAEMCIRDSSCSDNR